MRPRSSIDSILTYNARDELENWVPMKVSIGSWIMLQPGKHGNHAKEASKHGGTTSFRGAYKAKVMKFRVSKTSQVVSEALVRHAYMQHQLDLEPGVGVQDHGNCNYLYLCNFKDWVDVKSITSVIWVVHADVGEAQRGHRTHKELLENGIFFYNSEYVPRATGAQYGQLQRIPLPDFTDPEWPLPDMSTSEHFRSCLRADFQSAMRPSTGSRATHLQWWMPIHVMVDLFSDAEKNKTPTLFVFKNITEECWASLMDDGWDVKYTVGADVVKCVAFRQFVVFKYHLGRSVLYVNFQYNRQRLVKGSDWVDIDQAQVLQMVHLECEIQNEANKLMLEVGLKWSLHNVRQEILLVLGHEAYPEFNIWIIENDIVQEKVNIRNERKKFVANCLPPKVVRIVPEMD